MPAGRQRQSAAAHEAQSLDTGDLVHPAPPLQGTVWTGLRLVPQGTQQS